MPVRIFRLVSKICVKNILRIFQAHFRENVKNTEPGRKFHHSYKKKRVSIFLGPQQSFHFLVRLSESVEISRISKIAIFTLICFLSIECLKKRLISVG